MFVTIRSQYYEIPAKALESKSKLVPKLISFEMQSVLLQSVITTGSWVLFLILDNIAQVNITMNLILDGRMINHNSLNMAANSKSSFLHLESASSSLLFSIADLVYNIKIMQFRRQVFWFWVVTLCSSNGSIVEWLTQKPSIPSHKQIWRGVLENLVCCEKT